MSDILTTYHRGHRITISRHADIGETYLAGQWFELDGSLWAQVVIDGGTLPEQAAERVAGFIDREYDRAERAIKPLRRAAFDYHSSINSI